MERPYKIKPPKDLADYITRDVADRIYLIFDRKADRCRCTRCGAENKISEMYDGETLKHNVKHYCYDCCKDAIVKEFRGSQKNRRNIINTPRKDTGRRTGGNGEKTLSCPTRPEACGTITAFRGIKKPSHTRPSCESGEAT